MATFVAFGCSEIVMSKDARLGDFSGWLKAAPQTAPAITIADATGKTVRTIQGTRNAGLNRVYWDLRNEPSRAPRMRTKPLYDEPFQLAADGTRDAGFAR